MPAVTVDPCVPKMDASSAVFPTTRVDGETLTVAFHEPDCNGSAVVRFDGVTEWSYGNPNDEGLHEHPLWGRGLQYYEFHATAADDSGARTWIATFHDGTLTVKARSIQVLAEHVRGRPWAAMDEVLGSGENRVLDRNAGDSLPVVSRVDSEDHGHRVTVARRNRLLVGSFAVVGIMLSGTIAGLMFLVFPDRPLRPILLTVGLVLLWGWWVWSTVRWRRELRSIERSLREAGVAVPDDEPIPVRLAENRESLVAGVIFLLLVAAAFVAYFGGWIGGPHGPG